MKDAPTLLDKSDNRFKDLHNSLGVLLQRLQENNIGSGIAHHEPFQKEVIDQLWEYGLLGTSNPQALLNAVAVCVLVKGWLLCYLTQ